MTAPDEVYEGTEVVTPNRFFSETWTPEKVFVLVAGVVAVGFGLFFIISYSVQYGKAVKPSE